MLKRYEANERHLQNLLDQANRSSNSASETETLEHLQSESNESNNFASIDASQPDFHFEADELNPLDEPIAQTNVSDDERSDQCSGSDNSSDSASGEFSQFLVANELLKLKIEDSLCKSTISKFLKLVNKLSRSKFGENLMPVSYNAVVKIAGLKEDRFRTHIGFVCKFCKNQVRVLKSKLANCTSCGASVSSRAINNEDHFWHFDLESQLKVILNHKNLSSRTTDEELIKSVFDADICKQYQSIRTNPNDRLMLITLFSDGVQVSHSSKSEVWPIYLKINDLDCSQEEKTFLYSCFHGSSKPDPEFFLEGLLDSLIKLSSEGIFVNKLGFRVYPMLAINVFDTPARSLFLGHASHTGFFACTICMIKGERKCSCQLFKPQEVVQLRDRQTYEQALEHELPHMGVVRVCPFARLPYYPIYRAEPPDVMHAVMGGIGKRMLLAMFRHDLRDRPCFMRKKLRDVLSRRIGKFGRHSEFKRLPRDLNSVEYWKTNEFFQWFFYIAPICLKGLVSDKCYNHYMLLVYIISSLWSDVPKQSLPLLEQLIGVFLDELDEVYDEFMYVINSHLISHLVEAVRNCGPLSQINAFFFENLNFKIKKYVKSKFSLNDQIRTDSIIQFNLNLCKLLRTQSTPQALGPVLRASVEHFKKIKIKRVKFTSSEFDSKKKCADFFVKTIDGEFYLVNRYFKSDSVVQFEGLKIANLGDLKFSYKLHDRRQTLKLDFIHKVEITERSCTLPISKIF